MNEQRDYRARGVLGGDGRVLDGGCVRVAGGRVVEVLARPSGVAEDLGDVLITPTFFNAHCHLELTAFEGRLPRDQGFGAWVRELMRLRDEAPPAELEQAARRGARRLWDTGCALVHDVDTTGAAARALLDVPIEAVVHREAIDAGDATRRAARLEELDRPLPLRAGLTEGISPHAPFTCSLELLRELGALARRRRLPLTMHWAETEEEVRYLRDGSGPLAELLPPSPRRSGLDLIEAAGLLAPDLRLSLVHGNHPAPGDYERLAAAGVPLVHCPGTHAFFGRRAFDARAVLDAGVRLLLGTDSAASNDRLDMAAELRRFLEIDEVTFQEGWRAATGGVVLEGSRRLAVWSVAGTVRDLEDLVASGRSPATFALPDGPAHASDGPSRYPVGS
ncbi:MAG: amidohydrolase family protein [Planctomycetes bacterium]|nr:amidohydrolase family protein [Planctomycetota bacterium]MCB9905633.1 amidohydrolase family protein [Planctomycetota bacterium]